MSKKLFYSSADADTLAASDFTGAHLYAGDTKLTSTNLGGKDGLDVNIINPIVVNLDGVYDGVDNLEPDNAGLIAHSRAATPGAADSDNVVAANVHGLDVNAFGMVFDGTTWDRLNGTGGAVHIHDGGNSITVDTTSDPALANTAIAGSKNMAVNGAVTPVNFTFAPGAGEVWYLYHINLFLNDNGTQSPGNFGSGAALANGLLLQVQSKGVALDMSNSQDNIDLSVNYSSNRVTYGTVGLFETADIFSGGKDFSPMIVLKGDNADYVRLRVRDNLTGMDFFRSSVFVWKVNP